MRSNLYAHRVEVAAVLIATLFACQPTSVQWLELAPTAYLTIGLLSDRVIDKGGTQPELDDYTFGGLFIDAGLMASMEY